MPVSATVEVHEPMDRIHLLDLIERATERLASSREAAAVVQEVVALAIHVFPGCALYAREPGAAEPVLWAVRHLDAAVSAELEAALRDGPSPAESSSAVMAATESSSAVVAATESSSAVMAATGASSAVATSAGSSPAGLTHAHPVLAGLSLTDVRTIDDLLATGAPRFIAEAPHGLSWPRRDLPGPLLARSAVAAPFRLEGEYAGILVAFALHDDPSLTEDDVRIARLLAALAGQALTSARRYEEARRARQQMDAQARLEQISRAISQTLDLGIVLRMVRDAAVEALGFDRAGVFVVDPHSETVRGVWGIDDQGHPEDISGQVFPIHGPDLFGMIVRGEIPYSLTQEYRVGWQPEENRGAHASVPFKAGDEVVGILAVDNLLTRRPISAADIERLRPFCDHAAVAIRNARLHDALQRRIQSLQTLQAVGNDVRATTEPDTVLRTLVARAREVCDVTEAAVFLFDPESDRLIYYCGSGIRESVPYRLEAGVSPALTRDIAPLSFRCLDEQRPFVVSTPDDPLFSRIEAEWARDEEVTSAAAVPLFTSDARFGILLLAHYNEPRVFHAEEIALIQSLADHGAVALHKARLFEDAETALQRANEVNLALRQAFIPRLPAHIPGIEIGQVFRPASEETQLGGDFVDLFHLGRRRYGVVIGDVSGHDLDAAIQTAAAKYLLRAYADRSQSPRAVVSRVNRALLNQFQTPDFISLFYGIIDLKEGTLVYTNAGHEPPQLLLPGAGQVVSLTENDPLLAVDEETTYHEHPVGFPIGSTLVLFTDGVTEARRGEEFLLAEGINRILGECAGAAPAEIAETLWRGVEAFADRLRDDAAILVLRRTSL